MATIQFTKERPELFILGDALIYAVFEFEKTLEKKVVDYNYPYVDGVDYDIVGVGEETVRLTGRILSYTNYGHSIPIQFIDIEAQVMRGAKLVFSHPERGAFPVVVRRFDVSQRGGEEGYSFVLEMAKATTIRETEQATRVAQQPATSAAAGVEQTYTVSRGDSLYAIAQKQYGDGKLWPKIWEANKATMKSKQPGRIYPGEKLTIPPK